MAEMRILTNGKLFRIERLRRCLSWEWWEVVTENRFCIDGAGGQTPLEFWTKQQAEEYINTAHEKWTVVE